MNQQHLRVQIELRNGLIAQISQCLVYSQKAEAVELRNRRKKIRAELSTLSNLWNRANEENHGSEVAK